MNTVTVMLANNTTANYPNGTIWRTEDTSHGLTLKVMNGRGDCIATHAPNTWMSAFTTQSAFITQEA